MSPFRVAARARAALALGAGVSLLSACSALLGLGDYRDLCKPDGPGDPPDCVYADAGVGASSSGGDQGGAPACMPGTMRECYDGPKGPVQGICKQGTQECRATGDGYGPCKGQVLPQIESCASKDDENCDGLDCLEWNDHWSASGNIGPQCMVVDPDSHEVFVAGLLSGALKLPGKTLVAVGNGDGYLLHLDKTGRLIDGALFGDAGFDDINSCALDPDKNLILGGVTDTGFDVGSKSVPAGVFVMKLSPAGKPIWIKSLGGTMQNSAIGPLSIATDPTGDIVLSGLFVSPLTLDDGTIPVTGDLGVYLLKMSGVDGATSVQPSGNVWTQSFPQTIHSSLGLTLAALDSSGSILFGSAFSDTINLFGQDWTSSGGFDILFGKLTAHGSPIWLHQVGDSSDQTVGSLSVDSEGALLLSGAFTGVLAMPDGSMLDSGAKTAFAFRWQTTDDSGWLRAFGENTVIGLTGEGDHTAMTARFAGQVDFGDGPRSGGSGQNVGLAKLDSAGSVLWSRIFQSSDKGFVVTRLTSDSTGEIAMGGLLDGSIDLGAGKQVGQATGDLLIAKFGK